MEPLNRIDRVMRNGAVVWACLLTLLVLVVAILASTAGMSLGVWIFTVAGAVAMGIGGLFMLRRYFGGGRRLFKYLTFGFRPAYKTTQDGSRRPLDGVAISTYPLQV